MAVQLQFGSNYAFSGGTFAPRAKVRFFLKGTTTPVTTHSDEALTTPNPVPLVADASGRFPTVWGATGTEYKAVVTDENDNTIFTQDGVVLGNIASGSGDSVSLDPIAGLVATDVQAAIEELQSDKTETASPTFTGTPAAPTAAAGTNTTQIATTAFVQSTVDGISTGGTWTPNLEDGDGNSPTTVTGAYGVWRQVGAIAFINFDISFTRNSGLNTTSGLRITNPPVTVISPNFQDYRAKLAMQGATVFDSAMFEVNPVNILFYQTSHSVATNFISFSDLSTTGNQLFSGSIAVPMSL